MANYKNRKPKSYKGHCHMCSYQSTDGRRNGRMPKLQELKSSLLEREGYDEYEIENDKSHKFRSKEST